jgi:hypothetical protein
LVAVTLLQNWILSQSRAWLLAGRKEAKIKASLADLAEGQGTQRIIFYLALRGRQIKRFLSLRDKDPANSTALNWSNSVRE